MKRILVPTDFSENAQVAIDYAANLARKVSGEIYLLHVVPNEDDYFDAVGQWGGYATAEIPTMLGVLTATALRMKKIMALPVLDGLTVYDEVEVGTPAIHINMAAQKYKTDIIVMGTHGGRGISEILIGSTAEKVVQTANRPVITIRGKCDNDPKNIVFATDFSDEANRVFETVREFASIYNATLHLLMINTKDRFDNYVEAEKKVNNFREQYHATGNPFTIYNDNSKEGGILHFAKDINADMIAIGTHGRSGLARFFNGSVSEDLVKDSKCPVLTINFRNNIMDFGKN